MGWAWGSPRNSVLLPPALPCTSPPGARLDQDPQEVASSRVRRLRSCLTWRGTQRKVHPIVFPRRTDTTCCHRSGMLCIRTVAQVWLGLPARLITCGNADISARSGCQSDLSDPKFVHSIPDRWQNTPLRRRFRRIGEHASAGPPKSHGPEAARPPKLSPTSAPYPTSLPSRAIVTMVSGMSRPHDATARCAAWARPPQQGTSMRASVTLRTSLARRMAPSFSA